MINIRMIVVVCSKFVLSKEMKPKATVTNPTTQTKVMFYSYLRKKRYEKFIEFR